MDEEQERKREIINERTEKERKLVDAGESIRMKAIARSAAVAESVGQQDVVNVDSSVTPQKNKRKHRLYASDSESDQKNPI